MVSAVIQLIQKTVSKTLLSAKWQTTDCLETLIGCFPFAWKNTLIFKTDWNELCLKIKTDLTKILNPLTKPKPKTQHSFRLHEDLKHQISMRICHRFFFPPSPSPLKDFKLLFAIICSSSKSIVGLFLICEIYCGS